MSRSSIVCLTLAAVAMAGVASAQTTVQARFELNKRANTEENYVAFEGVARRACGVSVKEAGSLVDKTRIERECTARLLTDAVKATNNAGISILHAERTGAPGSAIVSRN